MHELCPKYGLSSCSLQKEIALVEHMQMNSCQSSPDLSDWMVYHAPLIPWFWTFSWLCTSNVCTPKIHIFVSQEDNAFMLFPLTFQVLYLDFDISFNAYHVVPREFLCPQVTTFINMTWQLVHCFKISLYAKCSLHFRVKFMFLVKLIKFIVFIVIGDDCVIYNSRLLLIVITQGFLFHLL